MADLADLYPPIKNAPPSYAETTQSSHSSNDDTTPLALFDSGTSTRSNGPALLSQSQPITSSRSPPQNDIRRVESQKYSEIGPQPNSKHLPVPVAQTSSIPPQALSDGEPDKDSSSFQLLISDWLYLPSFSDFCLACWCPHCVSGWNQMKIRDGGSDCFFFTYGATMFTCCCCILSQDIQLRLGAPVNSWWCLMLSHCFCWGMVLSRETMAIRQWRFAGKPRYHTNPTGIMMWYRLNPSFRLVTTIYGDDNLSWRKIIYSSAAGDDNAVISVDRFGPISTGGEWKRKWIYPKKLKKNQMKGYRAKGAGGERARKTLQKLVPKAHILVI